MKTFDLFGEEKPQVAVCQALLAVNEKGTAFLVAILDEPKREGPSAEERLSDWDLSEFDFKEDAPGLYTCDIFIDSWQSTGMESYGEWDSDMRFENMTLVYDITSLIKVK